jgi:mono/diheme cytochrome c family protein
MMRAFLLLLAAVWLAAMTRTDAQSILHAQRSSPDDLEVGGELASLPAGSTRYIRYEDLLHLPQKTYTVSEDSNLAGKTEIRGVALETLARAVGQSSSDLLIVAICDDRYRANYPGGYVAAHHPLLVLRVNGKPHGDWPGAQEGGTLGPYFISHPFFKPSFKVLSHEDEPQIPFGVVRIEFRRESKVFGAIRPRGNWTADSPVAQGFAIAKQDCFRCHNMGAEGGTKAGQSWLKLAALAARDGARFRLTIHDPKAVNPQATMPAHGDYDDATLDALTAYFRAFDQDGRNR